MIERKTRACLSCNEPKPLSARYWHRQRSSPDGLQPRCKECNISAVRKWQAANRKRYLATQQAYVKPLRAEMIDFKESHPCADCGVFFPYVCMSFDHLPGWDKVDDVSKILKTTTLRGRERLDAEIEKCDLVCMNCHAIRTHERWRISKARAGA
jgi:hypothetical protein